MAVLGFRHAFREAEPSGVVQHRGDAPPPARTFSIISLVLQTRPIDFMPAPFRNFTTRSTVALTRPDTVEVHGPLPPFRTSSAASLALPILKYWRTASAITALGYRLLSKPGLNVN